MTWDELFAEQFKEVDSFKARKDKERENIERDPTLTNTALKEFYSQWQKEREQLYERHKAEAEQYLDRREAEGKRLADYKKLAKEHPENDYWVEAVQRLEKTIKDRKDEEIQRYNERNKANSKELGR